MIEGQKSYWGDKCSDKFRKPSATGRKPVIEDLSPARALARMAGRQTHRGGVRVGLPRAMGTLDRLPFWRALFRGIGHRDGTLAGD